MYNSNDGFRGIQPFAKCQCLYGLFYFQDTKKIILIDSYTQFFVRKKNAHSG